MNKPLVALLALLVAGALLGSGRALASDYDGLSPAKIRKLPGFVADTTSMSSATNGGDPRSKHVYWWIGYVPDGDKRVYFTSYGEALTCVLWERTGEWVPEWVAENLESLTAQGLIKLDKQAGG
jgi:hypothetical protein